MVPQKTVLPVKINSSIFLLLILLKVMKKNSPVRESETFTMDRAEICSISILPLKKVTQTG